MELYIILYIFLSLALFSKKKNIRLYLFIYFILLIIGVNRNMSVGTDTEHYYEIYNTINGNIDGLKYIATYVEPGWVFINYICGQLFKDYRAIIFIGVFLSITPFFVRVWKSSSNPFLAIFYYVTLYFYYNSFNITRQMIAISIIIYFLVYLKERKTKKFVIGVLFAMLFHYSAIICLSFPFITRKIKISTELAFILLPITYIIGLYLIPSLLPLIPYIGKYSVYLMGGEGSGSMTRILLNLFFLLILVSCNRNKVNIYLTLFFTGIVMYNLFSFSSAVGRIALYFTCTQLFLFSEVKSKYFLNSYVLKVCSFVYASMYYFLMLNANSCEIVPYSVWK